MRSPSLVRSRKYIMIRAHYARACVCACMRVGGFPQWGEESKVNIQSLSAIFLLPSVIIIILYSPILRIEAQLFRALYYDRYSSYFTMILLRDRVRDLLKLHYRDQLIIIS